MRKSRFSDQQIALVLQQVENGASVAEVYGEAREQLAATTARLFRSSR